MRQRTEKDHALFQAAAGGDLAAVRHFLDDGADADVTNEEGWTPLMAAAQKGHMDIARLLIAHGANINATTYYGNFHFRVTPFHLTVLLKRFLKAL